MKLTDERKVALGGRYRFMRKAKLPLPLWILILATLFSLASTFGEWIGRRTSALRTPLSETEEQRQAAVVYVRVMSWLSRVISHPAAHPEKNGESARPAKPAKAPTRSLAARRLQLCALNKRSHPSTSLRKSCRSSLYPPIREAEELPLHSHAVLQHGFRIGRHRHNELRRESSGFLILVV